MQKRTYQIGGSDKIEYFYDAGGAKLKKKVTENLDSIVTKYAGNFIYKDDTLEFFSHPEGYVTPNSTNNNYDYVFQYKDHLGNIRLSYSDADGDGDIFVSSDPNTTEIIEENNYYPFGLKHKGYNDAVSPNGNSVAQKYKYNGVELEESLGLDLYEMDFRSYDPTIARFTSMDPVTHFDYSTYSSFDNNPIYWADPSGADSWSYVSDGVYRNNETGEETDDWKRAINETQNHFEKGNSKSDPDGLQDNIGDVYKNVQVLEKRGRFGRLLKSKRSWTSPEGYRYLVDNDGFITGPNYTMGGSGALEWVSMGGMGILVKLPKYLKYIKSIKTSKDLLKYAVKSADVFKLTANGNKFKAVLEGGAFGAGQHFIQLVKSGWKYQKVGKNVKLTKGGETIIFRSSKSGKKGFDTFTIPKGHEGLNVDIFFK